MTAAAASIVFTARAMKQTQAAVVWWRRNRPLAPGLLEEELRKVLALIAESSTVGANARDQRLKGLRRVFLRRSRYYVFYQVSSGGQQIEVVALWHGKRRQPRL